MLDYRAAQTAGTPNGAEAVSQSLLACLSNAGYGRIEPPILQGASSFLDLGGEDIRTSLYFTTDRKGAELCLRPEFTIPVCIAYLASSDAGRPVSLSYCGPVFRYDAHGPSEFLQGGLESFGRGDIAAADAEALALALEAAEAAGAPPMAVRCGDAGLLAGVLDALRLPANWQRRLKRGLDKGQAAASILPDVAVDAGDHAGVLAALSGTDEKGARALVDDLLAIAGITSVGGRSATEIAERFLAQVALRSAPPFSAEQRAVLDRFLAISGNPDTAGAALRTLVSEARLDVGDRLDLFEERSSFIAAHGIDLSAVTYQASFGRNLDYYTGFVFEASCPTATGGPLVGGGRYDRLAQSLGSANPIPAVGAAIWLDRISAARRPEL